MSDGPIIDPEPDYVVEVLHCPDCGTDFTHHFHGTPEELEVTNSAMIEMHKQRGCKA